MVMGGYITKDLAALIVGKTVVVGATCIVVERGERGRLIAIGLASLIAWVEIHEPRRVIGMHRKRLTDNATGNGAVKPLVHAIFREGHLGQAVLIGHHEFPDGIHLLSEGARLLPQLVFHLGMLVCGSPNQVRAKRYRE